MSKAQKPKGRPPKYVLDEEGNEIVGLSYNPTNNMYYATGTNPRRYICSGSIGKKWVVKHFYKWKENYPYTPEELEEQRKRNDIHKHALRLFDEGFLGDLIEKEARKLIKDDSFVKEELLKRAKELATGETSPSSTFDEYGYSLRNEFQKEMQAFAIERSKEIATESISKGEYDKKLWERTYDLIMNNPIEAAKIIGIPEIVYANTRYELPLSWDLAWKIFYSHKDESQFLYEKELYSNVKNGMKYLEGHILNKIKYAEFYDAFDNVCNSSYKIPKMDRLEILEDVFKTVKRAGYCQVSAILTLIFDTAKKI